MKICPDCGARLDACEPCDCKKSAEKAAPGGNDTKDGSIAS